MSEDLDRARRYYDDLLGMWTVDGFHYPHFMVGVGRSLCDLYEGEPKAAWERMESLMGPLDASGLGRSPHMRAKALARRASCSSRRTVRSRASSVPSRADRASKR